jgi:hypothetical protein
MAVPGVVVDLAQLLSVGGVVFCFLTVSSQAGLSRLWADHITDNRSRGVISEAEYPDGGGDFRRGSASQHLSHGPVRWTAPQGRYRRITL